jgi:hypothetical protein
LDIVGGLSGKLPAWPEQGGQVAPGGFYRKVSSRLNPVDFPGHIAAPLGRPTVQILNTDTASSAMPINPLQQSHYDVRLPAEDLHRLTRWLDCTSMCYGVYEQDEGQAQLQGEVAFPTLE